MMKSEFYEMTRLPFEVTDEEYERIEEAYYDFKGDKHEFCKFWMAEGYDKVLIENRAAEIQSLQYQMKKQRAEYEKKLEEKDQQIARLEKDLEREHEWKPFEDEHNVSQAEYEKLEAAGARELTDEEAADMIAEEFGFERSKIRIVHEVRQQEIDRHRRVRTVGMIPRKALFEAWDWNYIVFNVIGNVARGYEMHNGELQMYWA